jgi:hypothetical protein
MRVHGNMHAHEYIPASVGKRSTFVCFSEKPPSENKATANSLDMAIHTNFPKTMGEIQKASRDQLAHCYRCKPVGTTPAEKKVCDRVAKRLKKLGGTPQQAGKVQWPSRNMAVASFS